MIDILSFDWSIDFITLEFFSKIVPSHSEILLKYKRNTDQHVDNKQTYSNTFHHVFVHRPEKKIFFVRLCLSFIGFLTNVTVVLFAVL